MKKPIMFYFLLALTGVLAANVNAGNPVLDSKGRTITNGSYFVRPLGTFFDPDGGGLTLATLPLEDQNTYVGQERSGDNDGIPVKFSDWKSGDGFVPESENLNIEMVFLTDTLRFEPNYWGNDPDHVFPISSFIKTGPKPTKGLFQIRKSERLPRRYQFFFCPDGSDCTKVGLYMDLLGIWHLSLNATSIYDAAFVKVTKTETSSKTMSII